MKCLLAAVCCRYHSSWYCFLCLSGMDILGIAPGKEVADIGAGSGWFTLRAARRVGPAGTVYAVDINPEAIRYFERRVRSESLPNVRTTLSKSDDPMLPERRS
jgi:ubiquinone/menaquinone biosynthesis C-methylase UbiE